MQLKKRQEENYSVLIPVKSTSELRWAPKKVIGRYFVLDFSKYFLSAMQYARDRKRVRKKK